MSNYYHGIDPFNNLNPDWEAEKEKPEESTPFLEWNCGCISDEAGNRYFTLCEQHKREVLNNAE